jgi:Ca-activated chloride channel family protein
MVKTNLDEKLLKEIADITGGDYFRATDSSALHEIYAHINKMEKSKGITRQYLIRTPLYRYPLGAALVLLVLIVLLPVILQGVRRRQYGF